MVAMTTLQLPIKFTDELIKLPETGMGYQMVKVILKNGIVLNNHKVLNGSILVLEQEDENIVDEEIVSIVLL